MDKDLILLGHGSGGKLSHQLLDAVEADRIGLPGGAVYLYDLGRFSPVNVGSALSIGVGPREPLRRGASMENESRRPASAAN